MDGKPRRYEDYASFGEITRGLRLDEGEDRTPTPALLKPFLHAAVKLGEEFNIRPSRLELRGKNARILRPHAFPPECIHWIALLTAQNRR